MNPRQMKILTKATATYCKFHKTNISMRRHREKHRLGGLTGTCILFVRRKILGALPSRASPYNTRDALRSPELPELHADVKTTKLMIEGTTLMPDRRAAITNGDSEAVPLPSSRAGSLDGTSIPTKKMLITVVSVKKRTK